MPTYRQTILFQGEGHVAKEYRTPQKVIDAFERGDINWRHAVDLVSAMTGDDRMNAVPAWQRVVWMKRVNEALLKLEAVPEDARKSKSGWLKSLIDWMRGH